MESQKRAIILHGWASGPDDCWLPWMARELEKEGFVVEVPQMPDPKHPDVPVWVSILSETVKNPDENTYFVGHSMGCFVILKYLESLNTNDSIGGVVCVGGHLGRDKWPALNLEKIKRFAPQVFGIFSDNDYYIPLEMEERYREWGAQTLVLHDKGHFSRKEDITELPEARDALLELSR
ncbi:hypothetical protein CL654_01410 [bacterium]|nr:hypothetical protein [bacterium]|tara:strand:- start:31465 stop:32001 length:537 start_codon:yes stop_codon:yes gene_type:complete